ncbi:MAG: hypothetical protein Q8L48_36055 [Archangium sp.]|nr:hypothetical protein [Archangium sp.]
MTVLPKSLQARSDREAIREDIAPYVGMSVEERSRTLSELCRWARDSLDANPQRERAWAWEDKRSPESLALWSRLVAAARK